MTYFMDFALTNIIYARYTFICIFLILIISIIKTILYPKKIFLYTIPIVFFIFTLISILTLFQITSALNSGTYKLKPGIEIQGKMESSPMIHFEIAKTAYNSGKYLDGIVELENFLLMKPLSVSGYFYYYATYWKDFISKSEIGIPILSILKFIVLFALFISAALFILKL